MTSAPISMARRLAAVSVVKKGLPVPAAKMTTRPFSRWRVAPDAPGAGAGSGRAASGALLGRRLAELETCEAAHRHVHPKPHDGLLDDLGDAAALVVLDERLLEEAHLLVEALHLPFDDPLDHLLGLARLQGLRAVDLALGGELGGGHVLAAHVARRGGRHLHGEVLHELLELGRLGDEVGLAVDLDQHADLARRVDVGADRAVGGRARRLLGRLGEPALAQEPDRLLDVARRFAERLLAVEQARAGLLAQLLDGLERHRLTRLRLDHGVQGRRAASRAVVGAPGLVPGAALALLVEVAALDHRLGDRGAEESDGADGVVVARDLVVDQVRVAVRVDHRHHRDAELVGLLDGDLLLLGIDHEERVRELAQPLDAAQRGEELLALVAHAPDLLLGERLDHLRVLEHLLELLQAVDRLLDGVEVRQHAAEPARVDVERPAALGLLADGVLRLLLGADEQHLPALRGEIAHEVVGVAEELHGLLQVDDVDAVAGAEDVRLHLRVPPASLVAEVDPRLEQVFHGDISHAGSLIHPSFPRTWRRPGPYQKGRSARNWLGRFGSLVHRVEELLVRLRALDLVVQEFHRLDRVQLGEELAQDPDAVEHVARQQQLLLPRPRARRVHGREHALVHQAPVEVDLHVAGALELLEDDLVHAAAGVDQRCADAGEAAAVLYVARRAEELLRPAQRVRVDAPGEDLTARRDDRVVGAREPRDRVEQDDDVPAVLDQALRLLDHHLRHLHVARRRLVEGRAHHLALHRALHVGHLPGPLVDEQHDEADVGMVGGDAVRDVLQHHRLAGARRGDDEPALPLADRREQIDGARGVLLWVELEAQVLVGVERRQVVEEDLVARLLRLVEGDGLDLEQREVALAFLGGADLSGDHVAGAQVEAADLARRDVDVVGTGEVVVVGRAQEAEAVGQDLEHALAADEAVLLGLRLQDGEDELLLAHGGRALDVHVLGDGREVGDRLVLQRLEIEGAGLFGRRGLRLRPNRGARLPCLPLPGAQGRSLPATADCIAATVRLRRLMANRRVSDGKNVGLALWGTGGVVNAWRLGNRSRTVKRNGPISPCRRPFGAVWRGAAPRPAAAARAPRCGPRSRGGRSGSRPRGGPGAGSRGVRGVSRPAPRAARRRPDRR